MVLEPSHSIELSPGQMVRCVPLFVLWPLKSPHDLQSVCMSKIAARRTGIEDFTNSNTRWPNIDNDGNKRGNVIDEFRQTARIIHFKSFLLIL